MAFNPRNMDTRYTDMLLNFFGDIAKKEWEEGRKQALYKKNLEALKSGGFGDIYPKGISGEGQPEYGIRTPEEKMELVDQMTQFKRQQDIGKYQGAKTTLETAPVSTLERPRLLAMPKEYQGNIPVEGYTGNINLKNRPIIRNPDRSVSTEKSFSFSDESGKEILIPSIVNGKELSRKDAIAHYYKTGENLGKFNSVEEADAMAVKIHERGYSGKERAKQEITNRFALRPAARETISKTPAELQGRNFLLSAEGKYRETAPKLPKDMNKDVFSVAAKLAGDPLMYDDQEAYRQAIIDNIPQAQEILKQTKTTPIKSSGKSPYKEYPDAFQEGGVWKVMRKGKKYKIQE